MPLLEPVTPRSHLSLTAPPPWERQPLEPDAAWLAFLGWLHSTPRPAPTSPEMATQWGWAARACAFDASMGLGRLPSRNRAAAALEALGDVALVEARKALRIALASPEPTIPIRDIIAILQTLDSEAAVKLQESAFTGDLSKLSDAELDTIAEARKLADRVSRSRVA